jgi:hypothetical protein
MAMDMRDPGERMVELTSLQRKILGEVYALNGHHGRILVSRRRGSPPLVLTIGEKRLSSTQAVDALSDLYSRGIVEQEKLNRFKLSKTGRQLARLVQDSPG